MKKKDATTNEHDTKQGYNEHNPGQPQGAFLPDSGNQQPKEKIKSNSADKKIKEDKE